MITKWSDIQPGMVVRSLAQRYKFNQIGIVTETSRNNSIFVRFLDDSREILFLWREADTIDGRHNNTFRNYIEEVELE